MFIVIVPHIHFFIIDMFLFLSTNLLIKVNIKLFFLLNNINIGLQQQFLMMINIFSHELLLFSAFLLVKVDVWETLAWLGGV
jgi:hypothetical protein